MEKAVFLLLLFCTLTLGDVYMHNPRGSNNRLNEDGVNRANNNRLFDSQNNAKGGYCWGPPMTFYGGSRLSIEWTNQHGCGSDNTNCEIILQYMCEDDMMKDALGYKSWSVRDGVTTGTPDANDPAQTNRLVADPEDFIQKGPHGVTGNQLPSYQGPKSGVEPKREHVNDPNLVHERGMHEPFEFYDACRKRERNKGLFTADRRLGNTALSTRQNPNGGRSGLECPEERDYYPYWHPSPWIDIAVLTGDTDRCDFYRDRSTNSDEKNYCTIPQFNNERACEAGGGTWKSYAHGRAKPHCGPAPWNRDNHLGNGIDGYTNMYNWTIPNRNADRCVLRIRYNISSGDYDGWDTYSSSNGKNSPVKNDPYVTPYGNRKLRLAVDTTQFGRTFQDRSHVFRLRDRPSDIADYVRMWNLNVRGKRGNIVQAYPAVEYDFTPNRLDVRVGDYIHFQWTGCDTNPQGNDGEGTPGTDRSNWVEMSGLADNYPGDNSFFGDDGEDFAYLGLDATRCANDLAAIQAGTENQNTIDRDPKNCAKLNAASRYFDGGLVKVTDSHSWNTYSYMSTRNNNFTNRSQKGEITVIPFLPIWAIVLVSLAGVTFLGSIGVFGTSLWARWHPDGKIAQFLGKIPGALPK